MTKFQFMIVAPLLAGSVAFAQAPKEKVNARALPQNNKPALVLSEQWQQIPADVEHPVTQAAITNPNLELKLYGPA